MDLDKKDSSRENGPSRKHVEEIVAYMPSLSGSIDNLTASSTFITITDKENNIEKCPDGQSDRLLVLDTEKPKEHDEAVPEPVRYKNCPCVQELEGRDAWVVAAASVVIMFCISSEMASFGLYYVGYTEYFDASKSTVGWIKGIQTISGAIFSIFAGVMIKVYGCRPVAMVSGSCLFLGLFLGSFSTHVAMSYVTHGALAGVGLSVSTMCMAVSIQQHFIRNKVLGMGISYSGFAIGGFTTPIFVSYFMENYGLRGSLLIHSAILAHIIPAGLLLKPPRMGKKEKPKEKVPMMKQIRNELLDVSLLKQPIFIGVMVAGMLLYYNLATFVSHLPGRAVFYGVSMSTAGYLQSIMSTCSVVTRFPCMFVANFKSVNKVMVYDVGVFLVTLAPFIYTISETYAVMTIAPAIFGLGMGVFTTVMYPAYVHLFGMSSLPKVVGLFNFSSYVGLTLGPPISGLIFDKTNNYNYPFYLSGALSMVAFIIILVIIIVDRRARKQKHKQDDT